MNTQFIQNSASQRPHHLARLRKHLLTSVVPALLLTAAMANPATAQQAADPYSSANILQLLQQVTPDDLPKGLKKAG